MAVLGISSATKMISAGLAEEGKILAEISVSGKEAFTEDLMVFIDKLVKESGKKFGAVAVTQGPGAYAGLRGGLAVAKTLSQALKLPLVGVSTLEAIAYNLADITCTAAVMTDARSDEYNFALFTSNGGIIDRLTDDLVLTKERIADLLSQVKGTLIEMANSKPWAGLVAILGEKKLAQGQLDDPLRLTPRYSHMPNIREWKKK
ncbi:tRNA (adenosine(37)-N6)-threonylcarbamoyltransferase complex dimerization subunit type 1 TsaB [Candidatus Saganbacteria bacterium]|nr:tRNA (adenosine(37)-N6)-threonylcarbamoyltransferase complex dimerization subunit type 1 TsaB [Candidatus Saganbacteria bacterium]